MRNFSRVWRNSSRATPSLRHAKRAKPRKPAHPAGNPLIFRGELFRQPRPPLFEPTQTHQRILYFTLYQESDQDEDDAGRSENANDRQGGMKELPCEKRDRQEQEADKQQQRPETAELREPSRRRRARRSGARARTATR